MGHLIFRQHYLRGRSSFHPGLPPGVSFELPRWPHDPDDPADDLRPPDWWEEHREEERERTRREAERRTISDLLEKRIDWIMQNPQLPPVPEGLAYEDATKKAQLRDKRARDALAELLRVSAPVNPKYETSPDYGMSRFYACFDTWEDMVRRLRRLRSAEIDRRTESLVRRFMNDDIEPEEYERQMEPWDALFQGINSAADEAASQGARVLGALGG